MAEVAEKVTGYRIVQFNQGVRWGHMGSEGDLSGFPAFSKEKAEEVMLKFSAPGITYGLEVIRYAQYVELGSGEVVNNGPEKHYHYT